MGRIAMRMQSDAAAVVPSGQGAGVSRGEDEFRHTFEQSKAGPTSGATGASAEVAAAGKAERSGIKGRHVSRKVSEGVMPQQVDADPAGAQTQAPSMAVQNLPVQVAPGVPALVEAQPLVEAQSLAATEGAQNKPGGRSAAQTSESGVADAALVDEQTKVVGTASTETTSVSVPVALRAELIASAPRSADPVGPATVSAAAVVLPVLHAGAAGREAVTSSVAGAAEALPAQAEHGHAMLVTTPNVLEIGVNSGSLGWLKVRAELDGDGQVAASLTARSAGATAALHHELPAMTAYLADASPGFGTVSVSQTLEAQGFGDGMAGDAGRSQPERKQALSAGIDGDGFETAGFESDACDMALPAQVYGRGLGSWLSVRA